MENFATIVKDFRPLTGVAKLSILDVCGSRLGYLFAKYTIHDVDYCDDISFCMKLSQELIKKTMEATENGK